MIIIITTTITYKTYWQENPTHKLFSDHNRRDTIFEQSNRAAECINRVDVLLAQKKKKNHIVLSH